MEFARAMMNKTRLKIDIFGKCGENGARTSEFPNMSEYKFYFSFENSFCKAYITEKFFKVLGSGTIPIVRGANMR